MSALGGGDWLCEWPRGEHKAAPGYINSMFALTDRAQSQIPSIGKMCRFEKGHESMRFFGEGL